MATRSPRQSASTPPASTSGSSRKPMPITARPTATAVLGARPPPRHAVMSATTTACRLQMKAHVAGCEPIASAAACATYPKAHSPPTAAPAFTAPTLDALSAAGARTIALSTKRPAMKSEAASATPPSESSASFVAGKLAPQDAVTSKSASRHPSRLPGSSSCRLGSSSSTAEEAAGTISAAGGFCERVSSNALSMTDLSMRASLGVVPLNALFSCLRAAAHESPALAGVFSNGVRIDRATVVCEGIGLSSGPPVRPGRKAAVTIITPFPASS